MTKTTTTANASVFNGYPYTPVSLEGAKSVLQKGGAAFLAGRLIDAEGDLRGRFPQQNIAEVAERIRQELMKLQAEGVKTLVCSGANGADLLAITVAQELGMEVVIVLPGDAESFFPGSVAGRKGTFRNFSWAELYAHALTKCVVVELGGVIDDAAYAKATEVMTELLNEANGVRVQISVTEGAVNSGVDHTADAAQKAREGGVRTLHISTQR